jgi:hypothetical protein
VQTPGAPDSAYIQDELQRILSPSLREPELSNCIEAIQLALPRARSVTMRSWLPSYLAAKKATGYARDGFSVLTCEVGALRAPIRDALAKVVFVDTAQSRRGANDWLPALLRALSRQIRVRTYPTFLANGARRKRAIHALNIYIGFFGGLPLQARRIVGREARLAAELSRANAGTALLGVIAKIQTDLQEAIRKHGGKGPGADQMPSSDDEFRQRAQLTVLVHVLSRFGVAIGSGEGSPLVRVCDLFGVTRHTVRSHLSEAKSVRL